MVFEPIWIALKFGANHFARLLAVFFDVALTDRAEDTVDDEGLTLNDLQWVNDVQPVLDHDK